MLIARRSCGARNQAGGPCGYRPLRDRAFCFWHDPDHAQEARPNDRYAEDIAFTFIALRDQFR